MTAALIAYALAQLADVITTVHGLRRGAVEKNPVMAWLMARLGRFWPAAKLGMAGGAAALCWFSGSEWGLWIVAAVTALVAWRNTRV